MYLNNIDSYKLFLEKLGIRECLSDMADDIIINLKKNINSEIGNSYYEYSGEFNGKTIKVDCYYIKKYARKTKIGTTTARFEISKKETSTDDNPQYLFKLKTSVLDKPTIIHELKHLDYFVSRMRDGLLKPEPSDSLLTVVTALSNRFPFLNKDAGALISAVYYSDKNEFESYFNGIYYELKELLKGLDNASKRAMIKYFLDNHASYITLKTFSERKFDIKKVFRNNRDINLYIDYVNDILNTIKNSEYRFKDNDKLINRVKSLINRVRVDIKDVKSVKRFNDIVNKDIRRNYKKFTRLYTLLMDEER